MADIKEDFVKKLERRGFEQNLATIALCRQAYEGGEEFINRANLFSHCREKAEEYTDRLARAYYLNYSAPAVDTYSFFLFKTPVTRKYKEDSEKISSFLEDCDRKGTDFDKFIKDLVTSVLVAGSEFVAVDVPQVETLTVQQEKEANKKPYLYTIKTENVLDFEEDDKGLVWIKYLEEREDKGGKWDYEGTGKKVVYVIWSRGHYISYDKEGTVVDDIKLNIDFVPIVPIRFQEGKSLIRDIARINRSLFNWCSLLDELLYRQTFSWLIVPSDPNEPLKEKKIGTSWCFTFNPESKHLPTFISPDASNASTLENRCNNAIQEIYRISNINFNTKDVGKSGIAKAYDFMNINKTLAAIAYTFQEAERSIFQIIGKYYGTEVSFDSDNKFENELDIFIQYPTEFAITAVADRLSRLYEGLTTEFSKRFKKLCASGIVEANFPMLNEETKKEIDDEIETYYESEDSGAGLGEETVDNLDQLEQIIFADAENAAMQDEK